MWSRLVARSIVILALALLGQAPVARAMTPVAAPAVHTTTPDGKLHVRHHHRDHHRHLRDQFTRAHVSPFAPLPQHPAPRHAERRAAVPRELRRDRQDQGSRDGLALASSAATIGVTGSSQRVEWIRRESIASREGRVISGRGPPPARALESHTPALPGGPSEFLRSVFRSVSVPAESRALPASRARPPLSASHLPFFASVSPELLSVRSHVRRPEGTAACLPTPSRGESL
jgi:hypothetical protein